MSNTIKPLPNAATVTTLARRYGLSAVVAMAMIASVGQSATAQSRDNWYRGFELRPYTGAYIPTGDQRDVLKDAVLVGAQVSYRVIPFLALTGSFGWSPSKDRIIPGDETLDIYQYDLGAEARANAWRRFGALDFTPFVGLGLGGRTYNFRNLDNVDSKTNFLGYGALGGELGFGRVGVRIEGRDNVSGFKPLTGDGDTKTRNDVTVAAGLTIRF
jgi:hypothetical protein